MCITGAILGSAVIGGIGSKKAADAQSDAARSQAQVSQNIFDMQSEYFTPYRESGVRAQGVRDFLLGIGDRPMITPSGMSIEEVTTPGEMKSTLMPGGSRMGDFFQNTPGPDVTTYNVGDQSFDTRGAAQAYIDSQGTPYGGFQTSPGYEFRLREGQRGLEGSAAMQGGLFSGNTLKALTNYNQNLAASEFGDYYNRVAAAASGGQAAAGNQAAAAQNLGSNQINALSSLGNAQSAGAIGMTNALTKGIGNAVGAYQFNQLLNLAAE